MSLLSRVPMLFPDPSTANSNLSGRVVVAVHGTLSEPAVFRRLGRDLAAHSVGMIAPFHGARGTALLDASAAALARDIRGLPAAVTRIDVVGHSSGAVVALRALADSEVRARVGTLVGLGAPWRGTDHRAWYRPDWLVRRVLGESFVELEDLAGEPVPEGVEVVSIVSAADRVVPVRSSRLGRVIELRGVPHSRLPRRTDAILSALGVSAGGA